MNEIIALGSFLFFAILALAGGWLGKSVLHCLMVAIVLLSNFTFPIEVNVLGTSISWAIIIYSATYLILDIFVERYSAAEACKSAILAMAAQVLLLIYVWGLLPATQTLSEENRALVNTHLAAIFPVENLTLVTVAAILASVGWFANILIYNTLRHSTGGSTKIAPLFTRNLVSTLVGQLLNTAIIFAIVRPKDVENALMFIVTAVLFKWVFALIDTPMLWFATKTITGDRPRPAAPPAEPPANSPDRSNEQDTSPASGPTPSPA